MLTNKQVDKFQDIYRKRFGKEISRANALEKGIKLVRLMKIIYKPITEKDLEDLQKRRKNKIMGNSIIVKKSKISGKGVFALRDFKKGEIILKWNPKPLKKSEIESLLPREKTYVVHLGKKYFLMQAPERYVNHSCGANTTVKDNSDVAIRKIKKGEEITSDYIKTSGGSSFECKCGSKKCRKIIS